MPQPSMSMALDNRETSGREAGAANSGDAIKLEEGDYDTGKGVYPLLRGYHGITLWRDIYTQGLVLILH